MSTEVLEFLQPDVIGTLARAEIDQQIATAKAFPRNVEKAMARLASLATSTPEIAEDCMYALPRDGKTIEGPSVRFAELLVHCYGNVRAGGRVLGTDESHITGQGFCHDLETNVAIYRETKRRITYKNGGRYNADMIATTGNAATAIALRNAIFNDIPEVLWMPAYLAARKVVAGDSKTLPNRRASSLSYFQKLGVREDMILAYLKCTTVEDITGEQLATLKGIAKAIKDGETTVEQAFPDPKKAEAEGKAGVAGLKEKLGAKTVDGTMVEGWPTHGGASSTPGAEPGSAGGDLPRESSPSPASSTPSSEAPAGTVDPGVPPTDVGRTSEVVDEPDEALWARFLGLAERAKASFKGERKFLKQAPAQSGQWYTSDSALGDSVRVYDGIGKKLAVTREQLAELTAKLQEILA